MKLSTTLLGLCFLACCSIVNGGTIYINVYDDEENSSIKIQRRGSVSNMNGLDLQTVFSRGPTTGLEFLDQSDQVLVTGEENVFQIYLGATVTGPTPTGFVTFPNNEAFLSGGDILCGDAHTFFISPGLGTTGFDINYTLGDELNSIVEIRGTSLNSAGLETDITVSSTWDDGNQSLIISTTSPPAGVKQGCDAPSATPSAMPSAFPSTSVAPSLPVSSRRRCWTHNQRSETLREAGRGRCLYHSRQKVYERWADRKKKRGMSNNPSRVEETP